MTKFVQDFKLGQRIDDLIRFNNKCTDRHNYDEVCKRIGKKSDEEPG